MTELRSDEIASVWGARKPWFRSFLVALSAAWFFLGSVLAAESRPPNVLFIIVDDLNNRLGCYGDPIAHTPNMDRIAQRGVRFDRAYTQAPQCNPSRTSLLCGKYPSTTRIFENDTPSRKFLGTEAVMLPEYFQTNGYFTGKVGKVPHGSFDDEVRWDFNVLTPGDSEGGGEEKSKKDKGKDKERERALPEAVAWRALRDLDKDTPDGYTARATAKLIDERAGKPFFIAAGFHKPHRPYEAPAKYFTRYPAEKMPLPEEPADVRQGVPEIAFDTYDDDAKMPDEFKRFGVAAYYACIEFVDAQVGILLEALDRNKLTENTIVVLVSDHGYLLGEHGGMWRKMSLFEEAVRVPLLIAAPGRAKGADCVRTVESVDLYPTLVELCGLKMPAGLEGHSLVPLLDDPAAAWTYPAHTFTQHVLTKRRAIIGESVRTERWRYTEWGASGEQGTELYDHDKDPKEWHNLAQDSHYAGIIADLRKQIVPVEQPAPIPKKH